MLLAIGQATNAFLLAKWAIIIEAGEGKEGRLMQGSYIELRQQETHQRAAASKKRAAEPQYFVPESPQTVPEVPPGPEPTAPTLENGDADPFGRGGF